MASMSEFLNTSYDIIGSVLQHIAHALLRDLTNYYWNKEREELERLYQLKLEEPLIDLEAAETTDEVSIDTETHAEEYLQDSGVRGKQGNDLGNINSEEIKQEFKSGLKKNYRNENNKQENRNIENNKLLERHSPVALRHNIQKGAKDKELNLTKKLALKNQFIPSKCSNKLTSKENLNIKLFCEGELTSLEEKSKQDDTNERKTDKTPLSENKVKENGSEIKSSEVPFDITDMQKNDKQNQESTVECNVANCNPKVEQDLLDYSQKSKSASKESNLCKKDAFPKKIANDIPKTKQNADKTKSFKRKIHSPLFSSSLIPNRVDNTSFKNTKDSDKLSKCMKIHESKPNADLHQNYLEMSQLTQSVDTIKLTTLIATNKFGITDTICDFLSDTTSTCYNEEVFETLQTKARDKNNKVDTGNCVCSQEHNCLHSVEWEDTDDEILCEQIGSVETGSVSDWLYKPSPQQQTKTMTTNISKTQFQDVHNKKKLENDSVEDYARLLFVDQWVDYQHLYCSTHSPKFGCGDTSFNSQ